MKYRMEVKVWLWPGEMGAWHFVTVPKAISEKIKAKFAKQKRRGFGSLRVKATIGKTSWETSIFPSKEGVYMLPLKASVRKKEGIFEKDIVPLTLNLLQ